MTPRSIALRGAAEGVSGYCFEYSLVEEISWQLHDLILSDGDDKRNIYEIDTKSLRHFALANFPEKLKPHVTQEEQADLVSEEMLAAIKYFARRGWHPPVITGSLNDVENFRAFFDASSGVPEIDKPLRRGGPAYWNEILPGTAASWRYAKTLQACRLQQHHYQAFDLERHLARSQTIGDYELFCIFGRKYLQELQDHLLLERRRYEGDHYEKQALCESKILFHLFHALKRRGLKVLIKSYSDSWGKDLRGVNGVSTITNIRSLEVQL